MTQRAHLDLLDQAASDLRATSPAFTRRNLYFALLRRRPSLRGTRWSFERFCKEALRPRLRRGPLEGLLPEFRRLRPRRRSGLDPREWEACFPAGILLVDHAAVVGLFVASGALVQARIAVVSADGEPAHVVAWLREGILKGHRAPVGYLHDARSSLYPFLLEPLATLARVSRGQALSYRDLGIGPGRRLRDPLGIARPWEASALWLEELPPSSLVAYAIQAVLRMVPPDPMLLPIQTDARET